METYCYAVDIMALASTKNTNESNALASVMKSAVLYCSSTAGDSYMTGLSVTLPYGDYDFYDELKDVFSKAGFDNNYISPSLRIPTIPSQVTTGIRADSKAGIRMTIHIMTGTIITGMIMTGTATLIRTTILMTITMTVMITIIMTAITTTGMRTGYIK